MTATLKARPGHPYHMYDAIYAQPGALRLVSRGKGDRIAAAGAALRECERVLVAGIGTSWHAALVGELLLAHVGTLGHRARALHAFELAHTWPAPDARTGLVLVSHRGASAAVQAALARARDGGAATVVISGKDAIGLAGAQHLLETVEQEASGTHTASYTAALAMLALLAAAVGDAEPPWSVQDLADHFALLLGQESWEEMATRFGDRRRLVVVGGGPNAATAYEAALKVSETSQLLATAYHCEEFLHGPWAALEPDDLLAVVALPGPSYDRCVAAARVAREIGAPVLAVVQEGDRTLPAIAAETIELATVEELLSPILAVVPFQLLAYHWAIQRGANPDQPRADTAPWDAARRHLA
jgi:glucosamine--fructose-6-phosphate aminotransferase (isomerizing)